MSREEQIKQATHAYTKDAEGTEGEPFLDAGFYDGAKWADANRWISVKDEFPDNTNNCHLIIRYKNDGTLFSDSFIGMYNGEKWIVLSSKRWKELPESVEVTNYSPFPEPPKFDK